MINLLPQKEKLKLKQQENLKIIFILEIVFLCALFCFWLNLFFIKLQLLAKIEKEKIVFETKQKEISFFKGVENKLSSFNQTIKKISSFNKNQISLFLLLNQISFVLPEKIYLTSFSFDKKKIALSGFSATIEELLEFKKRLQEQRNFKNVFFPENLWLQEKNINFVVSFEIK